MDAYLPASLFALILAFPLPPTWTARAIAPSPTTQALRAAVDPGGGEEPGHSVSGGCQPAWLPTFAGATQELNGGVKALTVFDDGNGPALYAGGSFQVPGTGLNRIARWDGTTWQPLGVGVGGEVTALAVYDDGGGPALYVGGSFTIASGIAASRIAKWDGSAWSPVGGGTTGAVRALAVYDDGNGEALYVGGAFTHAGGIEVRRIARWDGVGWASLACGMAASVDSLAVFDEGSGSGPALYVGGNFPGVGCPESFVNAQLVARWDGSTWSSLAQGLTHGGGGHEFNPVVRALAVQRNPDGTDRALYVGGTFNDDGAMRNLAKWTGSAWIPLHFGAEWTKVFSLAMYDDGTGQGDALYIGCDLGNSAGGSSVWRMLAGDWTPLAPFWPASGPKAVEALVVHDDGSGIGPSLFIGGDFMSWPANERYVARWGGCGASAGIRTIYCSCDGTGAAPPCGNYGLAGQGCENSTGAGAALIANGSTSIAQADLALHGTNLLQGQAGLYFQGTNRVVGGAGAAFGNGLRCAGGSLVRLQVASAGVGGSSSTSVDIGLLGGASPGDVRTYQLWYRDPLATFCGAGFNLTNGIELVWVP